MIISGQLLTKVGGPIQWATITFDPAVGNSISFQTDFEGKYSQDIPVGNYRVYKKEKYSIDIELLGENVAVDATGTLDLESLIDRNTVPAYTAATLPDPATLGVGATVVVDGEPNVTDSVGYFNYLNWHVSTAIPFILQSSGSVGANGALTLNTAITETTVTGNILFYDYGCYMYFVAGAVYSGSVAGWYYVEMSSATAGTIYNNIHTTGTPQIPASKTTIVSASIGAYTQTTGSVTSVTIDIPANSLGRSGRLVCYPAISYPNNANNKSIQIWINEELIYNKAKTTTSLAAPVIDIRNRGSVTKQVTTTAGAGLYTDAGSANVYSFSLDMTQPTQIWLRLQLASASDYMIVHSVDIDGYPQNNVKNDASIVLSSSQVTVPANWAGMQYLYTLPTSDVTNNVARNWNQKNGLGLISKIASPANFCPATAGVYDYTGFDAFFAANADKDILFTLGWPADWMITRAAAGSSAYGTKGNMVPTGTTELNNYIPVITAMVQRAVTDHGRTGLKWELWNEIQGSANFKDTFANLVPYAKAVYQAIKAVDPTAIVLSPSIANIGPAYLLYNFLTTTDGATGTGVDWCDGLAVHLYNAYDAPWTVKATTDVYKTLASRANAAAKPLYATECGVLALAQVDYNTKNICRRMLVSAALGYKMFISYAYDYDPNPLSVIATKWNEVVAKVSGKTITKCVKNADGSVTVTFADASTYTV